MQRFVRRPIFSVGILCPLMVALAGCGDKSGATDTATDFPPEGTTSGECVDGADNDRDGQFDCNDADCGGSPDCSEANTPGGCADGADNDRDGQFDCEDPDCAADDACGDGVEGNDSGECEDGIDNDGDGLNDCADSDCAGFSGCDDYEGDEAGECTDGSDNDYDGLTDCADDACASSPDCQAAGPCTLEVTASYGGRVSVEASVSPWRQPTTPQYVVFSAHGVDEGQPANAGWDNLLVETLGGSTVLSDNMSDASHWYIEHGAGGAEVKAGILDAYASWNDFYYLEPVASFGSGVRVSADVIINEPTNRFGVVLVDSVGSATASRLGGAYWCTGNSAFADCFTGDPSAHVLMDAVVASEFDAFAPQIGTWTSVEVEFRQTGDCAE